MGDTNTSSAANNTEAKAQPSETDKTATTGKATIDPSFDSPGDKSSSTGQTKTFTQADIEAAEARVRADLAKEQKRKDADAKKQADDAELSDAEKHKRRAEELESRLRERDGRDAFEREAKTVNAANSAKLYRLYKDEIEYDADGKATNLKDILAAARNDYPEEFGTAASPSRGSADAGAGRGSASTKSNSMNDFIRRSTGRN